MTEEESKRKKKGSLQVPERKPQNTFIELVKKNMLLNKNCQKII